MLQADIGCHDLRLDAHDNVKLFAFASSSIDGSKVSVMSVTSDEGFRRSPGDSNCDPDYGEVRIVDELFALGSTIYEIWTTRKLHQKEGSYKDVEEYCNEEKGL